MLPAQQWNSQWTQPKVGRLVYPSDNNINRFPDYSHAGYRAGLLPIPRIPTKETLHPISRETITSISDRPLIGSGRSQGHKEAVQLAPESYPVHGRIPLNQSGVVLRGSGNAGNKRRNSIILSYGQCT